MELIKDFHDPSKPHVLFMLEIKLHHDKRSRKADPVYKNTGGSRKACHLVDFFQGSILSGLNLIQTALHNALRIPVFVFSG